MTPRYGPSGAPSGRAAAALPALVGSGLLLGLSFPPFPFHMLAWVALLPMLRQWDQVTSGPAMLLQAYGTFLVALGVASSWPLRHAFPATALASLGGLLLLAFVMALPVAASVPFRRRHGRRAGLFALASFYLVMEYGLSRGPVSFPWMLLGHTQAEALHVNQFAEWTGVPGLSLWVLLLNMFVFLLFNVSVARSRVFILAGLAPLVVLPLLVSHGRLAALAPPPKAVRVGLIQPGIGPAAWADVHDAGRVDQLVALTDSLLAGTREPPLLVIWPETALPVFRAAAPRRALYGRLQHWVDAHGVALLTGAVTTVQQAPGRYRNSALLFRPGAPRLQYDKTHLVPFAEGVPFAEQLPALERLSVPSGGVAGYRRGGAQGVLQTGPLRLGVLICFESLFGNHARRYIEQGGDLLVTLTQDGWWGQTPGYRQHLAFTRLRAVETRRAVVQVAVTGTTAVILPSGASALETAWMDRRALLAEVPLGGPTTFYSTYGDWLSRLALVAALLLAGSAAWQARRARVRT